MAICIESRNCKMQDLTLSCFCFMFLFFYGLYNSFWIMLDNLE